MVPCGLSYLRRTQSEMVVGVGPISIHLIYKNDGLCVDVRIVTCHGLFSVTSSVSQWLNIEHA